MLVASASGVAFTVVAEHAAVQLVAGNPQTPTVTVTVPERSHTRTRDAIACETLRGSDGCGALSMTVVTTPP